MIRIGIILLTFVYSINLVAQQWEAVPLVSQKILNNGHSGGEGCQWPQSIEADKTDGTFLLFGTDVGGIYRSINGGVSWEPCNLGYNPRGNCGFAIDPNNNRRALAVGANSIKNQSHGIYLTEDQGATWKHVLSIGNYDGYRGYKDKIEFVKSSFDAELQASLIAYWSSPSGGIYKTEDGGTTWQKKNEAFGDCILKVHPDSGFIYVADNTGLYKSSDGGATFQQKLTIAIRDIDVVKADSAIVYAASGNVLFKSVDGGETFTQISLTGFPANIVTLEVNPVDPNRMVVCNNEGEYSKPVYSTVDGGSRWQKASFDNSNAFMPFNGRTHKFAWHPLDENKVWAFGGDWITSSSNGGRRFVWDANGYTGILVGGLFNFNVFNPDLLYLASQDYNGAVTVDGGKTWSYCNASGLGWGGFTYGAYAANADVLVTQVSPGWHETGVLAVSRNGGSSFVKTTLKCTGLETACGDPKDSSVVYFSNYYSKDLGVTWELMEGCKGVLIANSFGNKEVYGADGSNVVCSLNKGDSWEHVTSLPQTVKDVAVDHITDKLYIITSGDRLFQFEDGQLSEITARIPADQFNNRRITTVAVDPNNPDVIYTAGPMNVYKTDATVKRSTDGGKSWQVISPSLRLSEDSIPTDGANEVFALRVNPATRELWAAGGCYGVWKFVPENKMTIRMAAPADELNLILPDSVLLQAEIKNTNGAVNKVEFFTGSLKLGEDTIPPYNFKMKEPQPGTYVIHAVATDIKGEVAFSPAKHINVLASDLPVVSIATPVDGSEFGYNEPVEIKVQAHDPDGTVDRLELYAGSQLLAEVNDSVLTFIWQSMESGNYTLTARAVDNSVQSVTSEPVQITIKTGEGTVDYFEDFNDGQAQEWIPVKGQWSAEQNQYRNSTSDGIENCIYQGSTFYDFTLSLKIKSDWDNNFGAIFNYTDESSYYLVELDANPQTAFLKMIQDGNEVILAEASYTGGGAGVYVNIEIRNDGNFTTVWINDSLIFDKIATDEFLYGKIGIYSWWNPIWVDDIHVSARSTAVTEAAVIAYNDDFVTIFPNPVSGNSFTVVSGNKSVGNDLHVRVTNLQGTLLHSLTEAGNTISVSTEKFNEPGIYLVTLRNENWFYHKKIVIQ